jgi:hypothetical protein
MLYTSYVVGITILAVLPLLFFVARHLAKRSKRLPWSVDDTLLALSLVQPDLGITRHITLTCRQLCLYLVVAVLFVSKLLLSPDRQHGVSNPMKP